MIEHNPCIRRHQTKPPVICSGDVAYGCTVVPVICLFHYTVVLLTHAQWGQESAVMVLRGIEEEPGTSSPECTRRWTNRLDIFHGYVPSLLQGFLVLPASSDGGTSWGDLPFPGVYFANSSGALPGASAQRLI